MILRSFCTAIPKSARFFEAVSGFALIPAAPAVHALHLKSKRQAVNRKRLTGAGRQGCIKLRSAPPRGADFQSAVSQVSNLRTSEKARGMGIPPVCRLEVGDTAGWKPALRSAESSELDAALAGRPRLRRAEFSAGFGGNSETPDSAAASGGFLAVFRPQADLWL